MSVRILLIGCLLLSPAGGPAGAQNRSAEQVDTYRCPKPTEFAIVFSFGYGGDTMPAEDGRFEHLLKTVKRAGFNTVHCTYTDGRLGLCRKHGVKMMIDLLAPAHHVYRNPDKARALAKKLAADTAVWGYNIWNDPIGKTTAGRMRDIRLLRRADPNHPAYCGTYRTVGMSRLTNADVMGFYDFHWKRAPQYHFPHLLSYAARARERNAWVYRWVWASSGLPGKGNYNRSLYTVTTSIACGVKGVLWFLGTQMMDRKTLQWTQIGRDITRVNEEILPLAGEIAKLGNPTAIYSTRITKTSRDRALPDGKASMMPPGLAKCVFPKDFPLQPTSGELVMGVFGEAADRSLFLANHNCYAEQSVRLEIAKPALTVDLFDGKQGRWTALPPTGRTVSLRLAPAGGALLRIRSK